MERTCSKGERGNETESCRRRLIFENERGVCVSCCYFNKGLFEPFGKTLNTLNFYLNAL